MYLDNFQSQKLPWLESWSSTFATDLFSSQNVPAGRSRVLGFLSQRNHNVCGARVVYLFGCDGVSCLTSKVKCRYQLCNMLTVKNVRDV